MRSIGRSGGSVLALIVVVGAWSLAARQVSGLELRPASWCSRKIQPSGDSPSGRGAVRTWRAGPSHGRDPLPRGAARDAAATSATRRIGRVDVCTVLVNEMARRNLLHEMAHIWIDQNVSRAERVRFLELRGLRIWNASKGDWGYRGYEPGSRDHVVGPGQQDPDRTDPRQRSRPA